VRKSEWAARYMQHLQARGVPHNKAVRSLSNKWVKILVAVLSTRVPYDEALHMGHLLRNQVPWAFDPTITADIAA